jgi:hypothetical protein
MKIEATHSSDCRLNINGLDGAISKKTELFTIIAVRTLNPALDRGNFTSALYVINLFMHYFCPTNESLNYALAIFLNFL